MKIKFQHKIAIVVAFAGLQGANAQKKDENIGTEVVNVVKPYTPTISDAFKVKETPVIEDAQDAPKEDIKYNIFSFPVASTFAPAKGKAAAVDKEAREKLFNNYATFGVGNFGTVNAELFVTQELTDGQYVGGMLRHLSSQGGIKDVIIDDKYSNTGIDLSYGSRQESYTWNADLGYQHQIYNWYGVPMEEDGGYYFDTPTVHAVEAQQTYQTFYIGGKLATKDSFFHEVSAQYKRFWDGFGSAENRFFIKPSFDVDIAETKVKIYFVADYVGGNFERDYNTLEPFDYSNFNLGVQPSIQYQEGDIAVQLGAGVFYSMGKMYGNSDNKIFIYPQVKASYKLVGDLLVAYAGIEGSLKQNSYADFVGQNPFVSPTLTVTPTNQQYDLYVGIKGKVAEGVAFNLRGSYLNEDDRAFFLNNNIIGNGFDNSPLGYNYGNSFGIVYDNLKTISFFGELKADFSKSVAFGINGTYNSYSTNQQEAWNLPEIKVGATLDVDITPKWYAGMNVFFVGDRYDVQLDGSYNPDAVPVVLTLDNYFDLNAHAGYKFNERLTAFLKLNNITGQNYERWVNYPVQGFQFLLGASYKFNF